MPNPLAVVNLAHVSCIFNIRGTPTSAFIKPWGNVPELTVSSMNANVTLQHYQNHSLPPVSVSSSHVRYQDQENTTEGLALDTKGNDRTNICVFPPASVSSSHVIIQD